MSLTQEISSWFSPPQREVSPPPKAGDKAPSTAKLQLPNEQRKPTLVTFLRHCGCPFAERTFRSLRETATEYPDIECIAVSHSDEAATNRWLEGIGGAGKVRVIVDGQREIYAKWGLGISGWLHLANPAALWGAYRLGKEENIWNRPTESDSRWQTAGSFAIDEDAIVRWGGPAQRSDEAAKFEEAVRGLRNRDSKL